MARKKFYIKEYDKATKSKIEIFREYFKESFPVFIYSPFFHDIMIFDFFAGQGKDKKGNLGIALSISEINSKKKFIRKKSKQIWKLISLHFKKDVWLNIRPTS